jgi:hypothetical protein
MDLDIKKGLQELYGFDYDGITDFYADEPVEKPQRIVLIHCEGDKHGKNN